MVLLRKRTNLKLFSKHVPALNITGVPLVIFAAAILGSASRQTTAPVKSSAAVSAGSSILALGRFFIIAPIHPGPGAAVVCNNNVFVGVVQKRFSWSTEYHVRNTSPSVARSIAELAFNTHAPVPG
jgi:hypothetical protein